MKGGVRGGPGSSNGSGQYVAQVTYEKTFNSKDQAERWADQQRAKLTGQADADSVSISIWEPAL